VLALCSLAAAYIFIKKRDGKTLPFRRGNTNSNSSKDIESGEQESSASVPKFISHADVDDDPDSEGSGKSHADKGSGASHASEPAPAESEDGIPIHEIQEDARRSDNDASEEEEEEKNPQSFEMEPPTKDHWKTLSQTVKKKNKKSKTKSKAKSKAKTNKKSKKKKSKSSSKKKASLATDEKIAAIISKNKIMTDEFYSSDESSSSDSSESAPLPIQNNWKSIQAAVKAGGIAEMSEDEEDFDVPIIEIESPISIQRKDNWSNLSEAVRGGVMSENKTRSARKSMDNWRALSESVNDGAHKLNGRSAHRSRSMILPTTSKEEGETPNQREESKRDRGEVTSDNKTRSARKSMNNWKTLSQSVNAGARKSNSSSAYRSRSMISPPLNEDGKDKWKKLSNEVKQGRLNSSEGNLMKKSSSTLKQDNWKTLSKSVKSRPKEDMNKSDTELYREGTRRSSLLAASRGTSELRRSSEKLDSDMRQSSRNIGSSDLRSSNRSLSLNRYSTVDSDMRRSSRNIGSNDLRSSSKRQVSLNRSSSIDSDNMRRSTRNIGSNDLRASSKRSVSLNRSSSIDSDMRRSSRNNIGSNDLRSTSKRRVSLNRSSTVDSDTRRSSRK